ncbi:hemin uptake protein HemP [Trinickia terrae]|uniref:Hemin uptake protein HemP n=1 Tax=Trinickia terrae TaxID=2571161 RepID=A0A4U1HB41_9BURK|nr:hemin uptake protein HemP [Trinickia terrae]TKC77991.1 hemin uptake protein HemP [Trinickia terrae]
MNDFSRASTLTLRRNGGAAASSRPKSVVPSTGVDRSSRTNQPNDEGERIMRSETLLQGRTHIGITHNGETYQLRATRLGKLILTK